MFTTLQNNRSFEMSNKVFLACLMCIIGIILSYKLTYLNANIAVSGWSPMDFARHANQNPNFIHDFNYGPEASYSQSLPMRMFPSLERWFPDHILLIVHIYTAINQALLALALCFFAQSLFNNKIISLGIVAIGLSSPLMGVNLLSLGGGLGNNPSYLYYPIYQIGLLLALGTWIKRQYMLTTLCLILSLYTHVLFGTYAIAAFFIMTVCRSWRARKFEYGVIPASILIVAFLLKIYLAYMSMTTSVLPSDIWLSSIRLFNYHYYPISMGFFTDKAYAIGMPILWLFSFYLPVYMNIRNENRSLHDAFAACVIGSLIIGTAGLLITEYTEIQLITSVTMQRITEISSIICFSYIISYLITVTLEKNFIYRTIGIYSIATLMLSIPGITLIPMIIAYIPILRSWKKSALLAWLLLLLIPFCAMLISMDTINYVIKNTSFSGKTPLALFSISAGVAVMLSIFNKRLSPVVLPLCLVFLMYKNYDLRYSPSNYAAGKYIRETSLWLKDNTPNDSLFMVNPSSFHCGWREFSERSFFGSILEWNNTSILYAADLNNYHEAMKRSSYFGFSFHDYPLGSLKGESLNTKGLKVIDDISKTFTSMSHERLYQIMNENNISYLVLTKDEASILASNIEPLYRNELFCVYDREKFNEN
jgi:hypothetical protein